MSESHNGLVVRTKRPPGFISAKLFAERLGISPKSVRDARLSGRFDKANTLYVKTGKKYELHFNWEAEGIPYFQKWAKAKWPKWYTDPYNHLLPKGTAPQQTQLKRLKDERDKQEQEALRQSGSVNKGKPGEDGRGPVYDMASANLTEKQLKVEAMELELAEKKNKKVDINIAAAVMLEGAQATRQGFTSLIPRLSPLLAAESSQHEIQKILTEEFELAFKGLAEMESFKGGK